MNLDCFFALAARNLGDKIQSLRSRIRLISSKVQAYNPTLGLLHLNFLVTSFYLALFILVKYLNIHFGIRMGKIKTFGVEFTYFKS